MEAGGDRGLSLQYSSSGRNGTATVTAWLDGKAIHVDKLDLHKLKDRKRFAAELCDRLPGANRAEVDRGLTEAAAELTETATAELPTDAGELPEVDAARIVRAERFITPEVSGLAVPTMVSLGDRTEGRWLLYLRWSDRRRERRTIPQTIELPSGSRLWVHPIPPEPALHSRTGWSGEGRKRWLAGKASPAPADIFQRLYDQVAYFLDPPAAEASGVTSTLALWSLLTYCYPAWPAVPYLYIGGPQGSGKTRTFEVLSRLVFRPLTTSSLTAASLFRTLDANGGTLLLDEAERLRDARRPEMGELLAALLAGYKRGGVATRAEPLGERGYRVVNFNVYGPKALACIAGLPAALASRCIPITMFRAAPGSEKPRRWIDANPAGWESLRDDQHALALEHGATWLELPERHGVCPPMSGRDYELWQPLLALAAWLESEGARGLLAMMQTHALRSIDAAKDDQVAEADEILLRMLAEARAREEQPQAKDLLAVAQDVDLNMFKNWTAKGVANALRRYNVRTMITAGRRVYRTPLVELRRIGQRYGLALGSEVGPDGGGQVE